MCVCGQDIAVVSHLPQAEIQPTCAYNLEQLKAWKLLLLCYKQQEGSDHKQINSYLGIVVSAISYKNNFCYFKDDLVKIEPFIHNIINSQTCP